MTPLSTDPTPFDLGDTPAANEQVYACSFCCEAQDRMCCCCPIEFGFKWTAFSIIGASVSLPLFSIFFTVVLGIYSGGMVDIGFSTTKLIFDLVAILVSVVAAYYMCKGTNNTDPQESEKIIKRGVLCYFLTVCI